MAAVMTNVRASAMRVAGARQQPMRLQKVACVNVSRRSMIARSQEETRGGPAASGSTKVSMREPCVSQYDDSYR